MSADGSIRNMSRNSERVIKNSTGRYIDCEVSQEGLVTNFS